MTSVLPSVDAEFESPGRLTLRSWVLDITRSPFAETGGLFQAACHVCFLPPSRRWIFNATNRLNETSSFDEQSFNGSPAEQYNKDITLILLSLQRKVSTDCFFYAQRMSTKIISIIDWQDAVIFPRFIQAGYPPFFKHDSSQPQSMHNAKLSVA
ncbi:kinase-like protein [Penicillium hordei]|uniref:Kinase-like protein n=1 Tax=Penicillium hordei TaxID=40994 RepID=A0AAD6H340_9EURO|nr:kinase-like protein [Penicillium hordei]KAJ5602412.1 kinase-like protein [Penicillium hordei]